MPTKVRLVKAMVFPVVMYGCESWTVKKAECQRIDAFELWCWSSIIWDTVCCEFAQTYCQTLGGTQLLYLMATVTEANTSTNVASTVAGLERSANTSITKFMKKVEKATGK